MIIFNHGRKYLEYIFQLNSFNNKFLSYKFIYCYIFLYLVIRIPKKIIHKENIIILIAQKFSINFYTNLVAESNLN